MSVNPHSDTAEVKRTLFGEGQSFKNFNLEYTDSDAVNQCSNESRKSGS